MNRTNNSLLILTLSLFLYTDVFSQTIVQIGFGNLQNTANTYPAPYGNWFNGARHQILIRAQELLNAGGYAGDIETIAFDVATAVGTPLADFRIRMKHTTATQVANSFDNFGLTTIYGPTTFTETTGWNTHTLTTPFNWDGTSNVLIDICFQNGNGSLNAITHFSTTSFTSTVYRGANFNVCFSGFATAAVSRRPNVQLGFELLTANNDAPCDAVSLSAGVNCNYTVGTTVGATYSTAYGGTPSCGEPGAPDVWYSFVAPISGKVIISTEDVSIKDLAISLYSATSCLGTFTELTCDDDSGPGVEGYMAQITRDGLTPGTTYYIRVWRYFSGMGSFKICVYENVISPNNSASWSPLTSPTSDFYSDVFFTDIVTGFAVGQSSQGNGYIIKTTDGGDNWTTKYNVSNTVPFYSVTFINQDTGWVVGGNGFDDVILKTMDGGDTWVDQSQGLSAVLFTVFFIDKDTGWAGGLNGQTLGEVLLKTTNGGTTWTQIVTGNSGHPYAIVMIDAMTGWKANTNFTNNNGYVYMTIDGGNSWSILNSPTSAFVYQGISAPANSIIYAVYYDQSFTPPNHSKIYKTIDDGTTWIDITPDTTTSGLDNSVSFVDEFVGYWVLGEKLYKTTDGGANWTSSNLPLGHSALSIHFNDASNGVIGTSDGTFNYYGGILSTTDGGITWSDTAFTINSATIGSVKQTSANIAYAATA
ncbi:MAG: hypothetical protein IH946_00795, partial [Bacteroidetes bacterium]|nr:hypothetical protein [Bacteroidota bacterium]